MSKYSVTKERCQSEIDSSDSVCERCGRKPEPIKTFDNAGAPTYWSGCRHGTDSGNFTHGIDKKLYELARRLVLDDSIYLSTSKSEYDDYEYWFQESMARVCSILRNIEYVKTHEPRYTEGQLKEQFSKSLEFRTRR